MVGCVIVLRSVEEVGQFMEENSVRFDFSQAVRTQAGFTGVIMHNGKQIGHVTIETASYNLGSFSPRLIELE